MVVSDPKPRLWKMVAEVPQLTGGGSSDSHSTAVGGVQMGRRPSFGLSVFLLATCGTGAIVGMAIRYVVSIPRYVSLSSGTKGKCLWDAKWRVVRGREELLYVFFLPERGTYGIGTVDFLGSYPHRKDITCLPEGLFVDGERVETNATRRVFVYTQQRQMRAVEISADDLQQLTTSRIHKLESSPLWKDKIEPIVREEQWKLE
jgi:hypothetical protein